MDQKIFRELTLAGFILAVTMGVAIPTANSATEEDHEACQSICESKSQEEALDHAQKYCVGYNNPEGRLARLKNLAQKTRAKKEGCVTLCERTLPHACDPNTVGREL